MSVHKLYETLPYENYEFEDMEMIAEVGKWICLTLSIFVIALPILLTL